MIRTLELVCSECGEHFLPKNELYYKDDYMNLSFRDIKLICDSCIKKWQENWKIKSASFKEADYVMTVDILLENGTEYNDVDCTPIDETETVVLGMDIPVAAQKQLYSIYRKWDLERKVNLLKECSFKEEFMRTSFSCITFGGESFDNVAFRVARNGELETEIPVPNYIKAQLLANYRIYELQNSEG